jgi:RNA polymerase sigma factor (sigma-70 family)
VIGVECKRTVRRTKTISTIEQVALCRRAQAGDLAARNALVTATMGLVYSVAHRWVKSARGLELDDLAAEGVFGLLRAIEKFDCNRGIAFITYASHWIKHFIRQACGDESGIRRSDASRSVLARDVQALVATGVAREQAIEVVAERVGSSPKTVRGVVEAHERGRPLSLDAPAVGEDGTSLLDVLSGESRDPGEQLDEARRAAVVRAAVARVVDRLPAREQVIVERRITCDSEDAATLAELGDAFQVSRERIRQLEVKVRRSLRSELETALAERPRRPCRLCGRLLRSHNRHGVCSAHGHSETFDRATGRCSVCGAVVESRSRGAHAALHRTPPMSVEERLAKQRQRHKTLRAERRARGECEGCGGAGAQRGLPSTGGARGEETGPTDPRRRDTVDRRVVAADRPLRQQHLAAPVFPPLAARAGS